MTIEIEKIFDDNEGILYKSIFAILIAFFTINNIFLPNTSDIIIISLVANFLFAIPEMFILLIIILIVDPSYSCLMRLELMIFEQLFKQKGNR